MTPHSTLAASPSSDSDHRSLEAYVVPRILDVNPDTPAVLTALLVREYEVVARGQIIARVRRPAPSPTDPDAVVDTVVTAPTPGLVVRCWAAVGEIVGASRAVVSMTSSDEALVVARFRRAAVPRLWRGRMASTIVGEGARAAAPTRIVSVSELPDAPAAGDDDPGDSRVRVVLRMPSVPVEALWPGTRATVEL